MTTEWPLVDPHDDGIRPAEEPDACLYCRQRVGNPHRRDCVTVKKLIEMRVVMSLPSGTEFFGVWLLLEPYSWTPRDSEFHKNELSGCANNLRHFDVAWDRPGAWETFDKEVGNGCPCDCLTFTFLRVVDATPQRDVRRGGKAPMSTKRNAKYDEKRDRELFTLPEDVNTDGAVLVTRQALVDAMRAIDQALNADSGDAEADALFDVRDRLSDWYETTNKKDTSAGR